MRANSKKPPKRLGLHEPLFEGNEWRYLKECVDTAWVSSAGAFVTRFEEAVAARTGTRHAVALVNGTAALHLALEGAGVRRGDEVLVPSLTFIATANAAVYLGARPRFVDSEEGTLGMDPEALEEYLRNGTTTAYGKRMDKGTRRRIGGCVPMHTLGHPAQIDRICELGRRYGIPVIEDAAESLGSSYKGKPMGSWGLAGVLSFNGNKILTTGGGGMVVTDDARLAARVRHLSTQAKSDPDAYRHDAVGYNYRLPNINAALGLAQLERLDRLLERKRRIAEWYREELKAVGDARLIWEPSGARSNFWLNTVRLPPVRARRALLRLAQDNIEARPLWTPCHRQSIFRPILTAGPLTTADRLWRESVSLPSSAGLTRAEVRRVVRGLALEAHP